MKRIFYEKVGRRYLPVYEYDSNMYDALPKGAHLIMCYPGGQSTRHNIDPAFAPMIAAGRLAERAIANDIVEASKFRPVKTPITEEQQHAWENLNRAFGDEMFGLQRASANEMAEAGVAAMQQEADKLLKNPAVRQAYDHFMLLCKLAKEEENV